MVVQFHTQILEEIRDYEPLKKKPESHSSREIAVIGEVISSPQPRNVSEAPVSPPGLISEFFPCVKPVCKEWGWWLFFQKCRSQQKLTKYTNKET